MLLAIIAVLFTGFAVWNPFKIRGIVVSIILPWKEGFFVYPVDYGYNPSANIYYLTWLCFHFRFIAKDKPFPAPPVGAVPPSGTLPKKG